MALATSTPNQSFIKPPPPSYPPKSKAGSITGAINTCPPILVRLATMVGPAKFWAMPLPERMRHDDKEDESSEEPMDKVLRLEKDLGVLYNTPLGEVVKKVNPEGSFMPNEVKQGILVAVRHNVYSRHWYRGRILTVMTKNNVMLARIFLIDYGDFLSEIPVRSCLRKLPKRMQIFPRPLAFQVILAGLRPVSWEMSHEIGLKSTGKNYSTEWSTAASEMVTSYYSKSKLKLADITNWQKDNEGKVHGTVELLGFTEKVVLNDILVRTQCAQFSSDILKSDLQKNKSENISTKLSNLSICGKTDPGVEVLDSADFYLQQCDKTILNSTKIERGDRSQSSIRASLFEDTICDPDELVDDMINPLKPLDPKTVERAQRKLNKASTMEFLKSQKNKSLFSSQKSTQSSDTSMTRSIWDDIREQESSDDTGDESEDLYLKEERKKLKRETKKKNSEILLRIPAGVDTGKYLEEQLKRGKNEGLGPRRIPNPNQQINPIPSFTNSTTNFSNEPPCFFSNQNPSYSVDDGW